MSSSASFFQPNGSPSSKGSVVEGSPKPNRFAFKDAKKTLGSSLANLSYSKSISSFHSMIKSVKTSAIELVNSMEDSSSSSSISKIKNPNTSSTSLSEPKQAPPPPPREAKPRLTLDNSSPESDDSSKKSQSEDLG
jgi:hypothetical protein